MLLRPFRLFALLLVLLVCGGRIPAVAQQPVADLPAGHEEEYLELLKLFVDAFDQIDRNYVTEVDRRKLFEAAVRGMLSELDPYSAYIGPRQLDRFRSGVESEFGGVGIQVQQEGDQLRIISPIYGTPAYEAGLMAGDVILEIAGRSAKGISLDEAVQLMKGKLGTEVEVKVQGPGDESPRTVQLRRAVIRVRTALGDHRDLSDRWNYFHDEHDKIGYIRLTSFGRHSVEELREALGQLRDQGMQALVLDLRSNPGGLLSAAVDVCDLFLAEGKIVSTQGRNSPKRAWYAQEPGTFPEFPLAVLVNKYSASASEIVAACLQDHNRAVVVGERTWGKGSVQNIIELEEGGSALKLTTAGYVRPSGANIHRDPDDDEDDQWGVRPSEGFEVVLNDEEMRAWEQAQRDRERIRRRAQGPAQSPDAQSPDAQSPDAQSPDAQSPDAGSGQSGQPQGDAADKDPDAPVVDRQLQKAVEHLREKLNTASKGGPAAAESTESSAGKGAQE